MKRLKILINAYACSPNMGSEPGMAWNWCINLAKHNELFIITEEEYRKNIESFLDNYEYRCNLHFYYLPVTPKIRKMAWNQGDWRFYYFYKKWQKKVLDIAKQIVSEHDIDVLHQLNMIGFREPGYLWKIKDIPYVWGPIGGMNQFPLSYIKGSKAKMKAFLILKIILNKIQIKYSSRVDRAIKRADILISATPNSYSAIKKYKNKKSIHIPETGCFRYDIEKSEKPFSQTLQVIWVGKFDFRKQLHLAIRAIFETKNKNIILNIYGSGSEKQEKEIKTLVNKLSIENQIVFHGFQSNSQIQQAMRESDLFFFTSVSEGTSTVVMEAISNNIPVLCFDACGFGAVVNETIGIKLPLANPDKSINDFAEQLNKLYNNRKLLEDLSFNCKLVQDKFSWENKAIKVTKLYNKLLL